MKRLFFIALLAFSPFTMAQHSIPSAKWSDIFELDGRLQEKHFYRISNSMAPGQIGADQIWVRNNWQEAIIVKFGFELKSLPKSNDYVVTSHRTKDSTPFFLIWVNTKSFDPYESSVARYFTIIPQAAACTEASNTLVNHLNADASESTLVGCLLNGLKGRASELSENVKLLVSNPAEWIRQQVDGFRNLKNIVFQLKSTVVEITSGLSNLDPWQVGQIACGIAGQMLPEILLATTGVGLSTLPLKLAAVAVKLKKFSHIFHLMAKYKVGAFDEAIMCWAH